MKKVPVCAAGAVLVGAPLVVATRYAQSYNDGSSGYEVPYNPLPLLSIREGCSSPSRRFVSGAMTVKLVGKLPEKYSPQLLEVVFKHQDKPDFSAKVKWERDKFYKDVLSTSGEENITVWVAQPENGSFFVRNVDLTEVDVFVGDHQDSKFDLVNSNAIHYPVDGKLCRRG